MTDFREGKGGFLKYRYFEIKVMTPSFLSITSPTKFYNVTQIIL